MRIYRTDIEGIAIFRISGTVRRDEALMLLQFICRAPGSIRGSFVLDFRGVEHVDYHVFELFEKWFSGRSGVVLSGMSDYLLEIFAFVHGSSDVIPIFSDWRQALHFLMTERGKVCPPASLAMAGLG